MQPSTVKKAGTISKVEFFPQDIEIASSNTASGVKLNWGKIENAVRYEIRSMNDTYKLGNVTTYTDKKAGTRNPKYDFYSLEAFSASGEQIAFGTYQTVFIKTPSLAAPAAKGGGKAILKWSKPTKATGYQIQYSTSSKFTNAKTVKITSKNTVTKTLTGLSKQKYYFRVRTYYKATDIGGYNGTYYSGWSSAKSVTVK